MAYRDQPVDPRVRELEALIAAEPGLRAQLVPLRMEHDEHIARADVMGPRLSEMAAELAKRRDGGVIATLTDWFGRTTEHLEAEVTKLTVELEVARTRAAELEAREHELWKQITAGVEARAELIALRERAIEALRIAGGPLGDECRALDADDARDDAQRATIMKQIDLVDFAQTAMTGVVAVRDDLAALTGTASKVNIVFEIFDAPFNKPETYEDREATRVRLADAIADAVIRLRAVASSYGDTGCSWFATMPAASVLGYANGARAPLDRIETTPLVQNASELADAMFELARGLAEARARLQRQCDERQRRRLELVGMAG